MDFGKREDGTPKTFTDIEVAALSQALDDDARKFRAGKTGCMYMLFGIAQHFFNAMLLMFLVALLGHPLGYLVCLLAVYTVSSIFGSATMGGNMMLVKIYKRLGGEE